MEISPYFDEMSIPLSTILRLEPLKADPNYSLVIICKDTRAVRVEFDAAGSFTSTFLDVLSSHAFPGAVAQTFAFFNKQHFPQPRFPLSGGMDWWTLYSAQEEFSRQGVIPSDLWYLYNDNYSTVDTYPRDFILPSQFSMSDVGEVAKFRSKGRIPALTYRNYRNGAVLCRSAQPLVGVLRHRSQADKFLLNLFRLRGDVNDRSEIDSPSDFYVFDCRKPIAATANSALGKGVEDEKAYEHAKVIFLDIENIHTMRSCCRALEEALSTVGYGGTQLDSASASNTADSDSRFMSRIEETEWLVHIRKILQASLQVAEKLELERASVLVHCSDGWDRTAQVCATTQVLLDPFFRTLKGLAVLVEKDWCSFGYKFQDRMGHAESTADSQERSPVFLQVWVSVCVL
ncbi:Mtm1 [Symbiodinium microadriaticum]|nr:Mtm1 [Symbiodinium microadriaticum]